MVPNSLVRLSARSLSKVDGMLQESNTASMCSRCRPNDHLHIGAHCPSSGVHYTVLI
ncbi:hypothetical protein B0H17DRAFT_1101729, partial [Mycena rosella]